MLPLSLLKTSHGHPVLIELKNGETYNGHLVLCDTWMNIHLREVICTSKDADKFWRMPEVYIRGNTIKYIRVPEEVLEKVKDEDEKMKREDNKRPASSSVRGGRGGRGGSFAGRDGGRGGEGGGGRGPGRGEGGPRGGRAGGRGRG